jgi:hypothetical protein
MFALALHICSAQPSIQLAPNSFDFGSVEGGTPVDTSFTLTNAGNTNLVISQITTSCGCTTVGDWERALAPGHGETIAIHFDSANYNGHIEKLVTIQSNDPHAQSLFFNLTGNVHQAMAIQPSFLLLHANSAGTSEGTVTLTNQQAIPLEIKEISSGNPAFNITVHTNITGQSFTLQIKTRPPYMQGLQTMVRVFTTNGKEGHFVAIVNQPTAQVP